MSVITRFAPSPTGYLHIGSARTALFNWLYARRHEGRFLLRVEDTDRARSTDDAVQAIYDGLRWLGLDWDGDAVSQFARRERHQQVAYQLLEAGHAYRCYASVEELEEMRAKAKADGRAPRYDGRWRDRDPMSAPSGVTPVIRFKAPLEGDTVIEDAVQGQVRVPNAELDDMILMRSDGTATYMLAVVVDDHDMDVSHVIRGDDHFTNAFRQYQLYEAMGWSVPTFAHIPLIHGPDGAKLSKRHGALGVEAYREMGFLPEAMRNYLLRLGWSHGDDEIISTDQAVSWFNLEAIGRAAARFDIDKLTALNAHYIRETPDDVLFDLIADRLAATKGASVSDEDRRRLTAAMPALKQRAKTLNDLADNGRFLLVGLEPDYDSKAEKLIIEGADQLDAIAAQLDACAAFESERIEATLRGYAEETGLKLGKVLQPLRAALTGTTVSPPIFEAAAILGKEETLFRLNAARRYANEASAAAQSR